MSADKLVFDLSQEIEGQPQVFIRKDWLSILDNMNANYSANQTIIDTSQLSNSNKMMSYREGYLSIPLLLTLTGAGWTVPVVGNGGVPLGMSPTTTTAGAGNYIMGTACDYVMGLKQWFGSVIHSFTLDMNGTTIIQQTPFINMVNCFRLQTSLSWGDILSQGPTIGYWPDTPTSFTVNGSGAVAGPLTGAPAGQGVCNNTIYPGVEPFTPGTADNIAFARYDSGAGNLGLVKRIQMINLDPDGVVGVQTYVPLGGVALTYKQLMQGSGGAAGAGTSAAFRQLWMSHIFNKVTGAAGTVNTSCLQIAVCATVYLRHIHNFFSMVPLLKGTFFKMTAFLNNASVGFTVSGKISDAGAAATRAGVMSLDSASVPVGGVCPLMITSADLTNGGSDGLGNGAYIASLSVGSRLLNTTQKAGGAAVDGPLSQSIYLYVPAYTLNPVFESAYLSSPVKSIKYVDYYQYVVQGVTSGQTFNNLITNGIANIKSVLIIPYYSASAVGGAAGVVGFGGGSGLPSGVPVYQSPFDPAGAGSTSPMCLFSNFNVVISGQNAIYNTEQRMFEHYNDQLKGCNSVNGDMTDGLTSGFVSALNFQSSQCFWYTNVGRQLPVEEAVPKSVQIVGQNQSAFALDLFVFVEYGVSVDVDALTGARV